MWILVFFLVTVEENKVIEVHFTEQAPRIDGVIEDIWDTADSAYDFVQFEPYEKTPATERTVVYVLQDENNLYFAFRCYAEQAPPTACLTADEDDIRIGIDPFGSKTTAYYFQVFGSNIRYDGWILDDGRTYDDSWDGVWYRAIKIYDDYYDVEIKIPFKSIRYKKGLDEWGIIFGRYIAHNREYDLWKEFSQREGILTSKYGILKGVNPQAHGYYFEIYPEGYIRNDTYEDDVFENFGENTELSASLNLKWDITPQTTINATINPDFAQIESDPFTLNLSRYPTYFDERRPFFLEGMDIFRMSEFGGWGFFDPLEIFYSRRIGKSLNGDAVPIIGGLKLTSQSKDWNVGVLGAYTDEYAVDDSVVEPDRWFGVMRAKRRILHNSDVGVLFSGTRADTDDYNYALGVDGVYRAGANQFVVQSAVSDQSGKQGWAVDAGYFGYLGSFVTFTSARVISDSFDVSNIGFVPWVGEKQVLFMTGPYRQYDTGAIRDFFVAPGVIVVQEPGEEDWSVLGLVEWNTDFRNNWGFDMNLGAGKAYEADTDYVYRSFNLSVWGRIYGNHINFGCNYEYSYNYARGFLAYQGGNWFSYSYSIIPNLSAGLATNYWIEWDDNNSIIAMWPRLRPQIFIRFNADMNLSIFDELVYAIPETNWGETELLTNRVGMLFSWNFLPKSWLYIALNDYRAQDEFGDLQHQYTISAIKAKYLVYF